MEDYNVAKILLLGRALSGGHLSMLLTQFPLLHSNLSSASIIMSGTGSINESLEKYTI